MATKIVKKRHLEAARPFQENGNEQIEYTSSEETSATEVSDEASSVNSSHTDTKEMEQILKRILKLSNQADNPGMAYRNLETIHALAESLAKKMGMSIELPPNTVGHQRPSSKL